MRLPRPSRTLFAGLMLGILALCVAQARAQQSGLMAQGSCKDGISMGRDHYRAMARAGLEAVFPKAVRRDDGTVWLGDKMIGIAHPSLTDF